MNDERLKEAYRQTLAQRSIEIGKDCVAPDDLVRLVAREGPETERLRILDHVMQCENCQRDFELLRAIKAGALPSTSKVWLRRALPLAAALAIGIVGTSVWRATSGPEVLRGPDGSGVTLVIPRDGVRADSMRVFAWRPVEDVLRYELEITDVGGSPVHRATGADTVVMVPDSVALEVGVSYRWWVIAVLGDGSRLTAEPLTFTPRP